MGTVSDILGALSRTGFSLVTHFKPSDAAWWDDFYTPMQRRIEQLREKPPHQLGARGCRRYRDR